MDDRATPTARRNPHLVRTAIVSLLLIVGVGGFIFLFASGKAAKNRSLQPAAVEVVSPGGGELDLRQATIMADLAPGYEGHLELDGIELPGDEVQWVPALNTLTLRPPDYSAYRQLAPGRHCAAVVYHRTGTPIADSATYHWCFTLH